MFKSLLILMIFGVPAAFCLRQAYKIQSTWAGPDGRLKARGKRSRMYLWTFTGAGLALMGLVFAYASVDPAFNAIGKR